MTGGNGDVVRLKKLLRNGSRPMSTEVFEILKSDLTTLLSSYFEDLVTPVDLTVSPDDNGDLIVAFSARASAVKDLKIL